MAFPTLSTASLGVTLNSALAAASALRAEAVTIRNLCAQPLDATRLLLFMGFMADKADQFTALAAVPGLGAYAQEQFNNGSFNIGAEFTTMQTALTNTRTWIASNYPKAAGGEVLERKFDGNGRLTTNTFSTVQTAGLVTVLDALIATIG